MCTSKVLSVSSPEEMVSRVENLARAEDGTVREFVREAIRRYESLKADMPAVRSSVAKATRGKTA